MVSEVEVCTRVDSLKLLEAEWEAEGLMILEICKDIERRLGRTGKPQYNEKGERIYTSRPIDIDILLFGDHNIDCEELTVPHKLMNERDFVMIPLREINNKL